MNSKRITFGIGIVLVVLVVLAAPVMAHRVHFEPQHSNATTGDTIAVATYFELDADETLLAGQLQVLFDVSTANVTDAYLLCQWVNPTGPNQYCWGAFDVNFNSEPNGSMWGGVSDPQESDYFDPPGPDPLGWYYVSTNDGMFHGPITVEVSTYEVKADGVSGVSPLDFGDEQFPPECPLCQECMFCNGTGITLDVNWEDGTFTHDYAISGYATGSAANRVNITNLNKPDVVDDRAADVNATTGFYSLVLDMPSEVEDGDELQIIACQDLGNNESKCNVSTHIVTAPGHETNVNLTLNHFCRNPVTYPFHTWNESNWSGPAVMEMLIDHYRNPPNVPNQTELNEIGIGYNLDCNADLQYVDANGTRATLNKYLHAYNGLPYVANYGIGSNTDINDTLHYMCKWHYLGPGAAPAYGDYSNWMVIRGIHTDVKPSFAQGSYEIKGFWINDPKDPGGIGENAYKSVEQWKGTYHKMLNVNPLDIYNGTYVAVCEPPEDDDVEVTLAKPKPRLTEAITPMLAEKPLMVYGVEQLALEKVVKDDEALRIVAAAIDGVNEELVPYDALFAGVFAKTVPGSPMLVASEAGDYYVVPFNVPVELKPIKKVPVEIEKVKISGLKDLERVKRVDERIIIKPIAIEPIKIERTLVVVVVDADDGSFKEASWVGDPVEYLPVSKIEALKLALGEIAITDSNELRALGSKPTIELVYRAASPYYPDWKITVDDKVFYVNQDGTVSS